MNRFLLIDDDDIICIVHPTLIRIAIPEAEIEIVRSAKDALELLKELSNENIAAPDYIFLDINMPEMTGFELMDKLSTDEKVFLKESKIFMLSSTIDHRDLEKVKQYEMIKGFVSKPLTIEFIQEHCSN